jgi:hypothetical protein
VARRQQSHRGADLTIPDGVPAVPVARKHMPLRLKHLQQAGKPRRRCKLMSVCACSCHAREPQQGRHMPALAKGMPQLCCRAKCSWLTKTKFPAAPPPPAHLQRHLVKADGIRLHVRAGAPLVAHVPPPGRALAADGGTHQLGGAARQRAGGRGKELMLAEDEATEHRKGMQPAK